MGAFTPDQQEALEAFAQLSAARAGAVQEALKQLTASLVALNLALFAQGALTEDELRDEIKQAEALGALEINPSPGRGRILSIANS